MYNKERVQKIYETSRNYGRNLPFTTFEWDFQEFALGEFNHLPVPERIAKSMAAAIVKQPVYIHDFDRVIGRLWYHNAKPVERWDPEIIDIQLSDSNNFHPNYEAFRKNQLVAFNCPGHIAWDWNSILKYGTEGLRARCHECAKWNTDDKSKEFYAGVLTMIDALEAWNDKHVEELERRGMTEMAEICRRVPKYPARTFHEAVQSFFMQHLVVMRENPNGGNSPGRLDYYLWPYLEADLAAGRTTLEDAAELIAELFIRIDERIHGRDLWVEALAIGGSHPNGTSAINPLTYIMIEEIMKFDITHPSVYVRFPKNPPEDFVKLCAKYLKEGGNRAQILSDESIVKALTLNGVPYYDAVDYFCGGCMEIGVQGQTADFLFVGYQNIAKFAELSLTGGYCLNKKEQVNGFRGKPLTEYTDFESLYNDFINEFRRITHLMFKWEDWCGEKTEKVRPCYLLSSMIADCISKGRNMHGGGARYYDYGLAVIGLANAADSLIAVKKAVFDDKLCTAEELLDALKANFEGYEELRAMLMKLPKYGQDNAEADAIMQRIVADVGDVYKSYRNRFGGNGKLVILTFVYAPGCGKVLGASPDGRLAGKVVAQGVTPQGSSMKCGITAAMNSCTSIPFEVFAGGASSMWDLDESFASEEIIAALVNSFFEGGGQIFQGNTTDVKTLLDAQKSPEDYYNLIVRVGGFSARFISLDKSLQDEIINRTRHTK